MANGLTSAIGFFRSGIFQVGWLGQAAQFSQDRVQADHFYRRGDDEGKGSVLNRSWRFCTKGYSCPDALLAWPQSCKHRGARRVALRLLAICLLEHPAALGQAIDVRADQVPFAKATQLRP